MSFFQSPWFVPTMIALILFCLAYLFISPSRTRQQHKINREVKEGKLWHVQCPQCNRWKEMAPVQSDRMDSAEVLSSPQPGMQHPFTNKYKCPFCGHFWEEKYVE